VRLVGVEGDGKARLVEEGEYLIEYVGRWREDDDIIKVGKNQVAGSKGSLQVRDDVSYSDRKEECAKRVSLSNSFRG
jgi:hypothetical protein